MYPTFQILGLCLEIYPRCLQPLKHFNFQLIGFLILSEFLSFRLSLNPGVQIAPLQFYMISETGASATLVSLPTTPTSSREKRRLRAVERTGKDKKNGQSPSGVEVIISLYVTRVSATWRLPVTGKPIPRDAYKEDQGSALWTRQRLQAEVQN